MDSIVLGLVVLSVVLRLGMATESYYVCEAGDEKVLGEYKRDDEMKIGHYVQN